MYCSRHGPAPTQVILIEPSVADCKALTAQLLECNYEGTKLHLAGVGAYECYPLHTIRFRYAVRQCTDENEASLHISQAEEEFDLLICEVRTTEVAPVHAPHWSARGTEKLRMYFARVQLLSCAICHRVETALLANYRVRTR